MNTTVYLGLGANVGNAAEQIAAAVMALGESNVVLDQSPLYRTRPYGCSDQPDFLNGAVKVETMLNLVEFHSLTKKIERRLGRTPTFRNGPRNIDIDILLFGLSVSDMADITVPHRDLLLRDFALRPLLDLDPALIDPRNGYPLTEALAKLPLNERYVIAPYFDPLKVHLKANFQEAVVRLLDGRPLVFEGILDCRGYAALVRALHYEEQPKEFGPRKVRQDVSSVPVKPDSPLKDLVLVIEKAIVEFFGPYSFSPPLRFTDSNIQRYRHKSHGIDPHRDHSNNRNVVALLTLDGSGLFSTYEELGGAVKSQVLLSPGSLLLMTAPGFLGNVDCPVHGVDSIVGGNDSWRYLLGMRHNISLL